MNYAVLSDVTKIIMGQSPPSSTYNTNGESLPFFQGKADFGDLYPMPRVYCSEPNRIAEPGDILITVRAPVGPTNLNRVRSCIGRGLSAIRVGSHLDRNYLLYFLRFYEPELAKAGTGSTFAAISRDDLENIKLPLPPLAEQQSIADLLARADRLRRLRRYARELSDTYLQSVFVEMFYKQSNKSWARLSVAELALKGTNKIRTGPFGSQLLHSEFQEEGDVAVLGIDNAVQNYFTWGKPRYITFDRYKQLKRYTVFPGDVIITIMATTGRCAVVPETIPLAINTKHLCCITLDQKKCLPSFLHASFLYNPSVIRQMGGSERGAIMPGLNMEIIKNLEIFLPPMSLQERFADIVQYYERFREQQRESERQAEMLFQSLLAQAFT